MSFFGVKELLTLILQSQVLVLTKNYVCILLDALCGKSTVGGLRNGRASGPPVELETEEPVSVPPHRGTALGLSPRSRNSFETLLPSHAKYASAANTLNNSNAVSAASTDTPLEAVSSNLTSESRDATFGDPEFRSLVSRDAVSRRGSIRNCRQQSLRFQGNPGAKGCNPQPPRSTSIAQKAATKVAELNEDGASMVRRRQVGRYYGNHCRTAEGLTSMRSSLLKPSESRAALGRDSQSRIGAVHRRCASSYSECASTLSSADSLRRAIKLLHTNSVRSLLERMQEDEACEAITVETDSDGYTLIHSAVLAKSEEILELLISKLGTDKRKSAAVNSTGWSANNFAPLHLAAMSTNPKLTRILLNYKADANTRSNLGTTPLHLAATHSNAEIIEHLLAEGADPNVVSKMGIMPLMSAVRNRSRQVVQSLLAAGANPRSASEGQVSARALALRLNEFELVALIDNEVWR